MLSKLNLNKFKEQKWLYFFIGSLFTALLAGGFVYFDVYNVLGLSTLKSDPSFTDPALIADSRAEIYGGITTNHGNAESGLIVLGGYDPNPPINGLYGKVGIGFGSGEVPSEMLEVRGNIKVTTTTNDYGGAIAALKGYIPEFINGSMQIGEYLKLTSNGIEHYETIPAGGTYWRYGSCQCIPDTSPGGTSRVYPAKDRELARGKGIVPFIKSISKYLNSLILPAAHAEPTVCDGTVAITNAQCDPGDTVIYQESNTCYGSSYISAVQCSAGSAQSSFSGKIRFSGASAGQPARTIIEDDLVAGNNQPSNCSWRSDTKCDAGRFMAGYAPSFSCYFY